MPEYKDSLLTLTHGVKNYREEADDDKATLWQTKSRLARRWGYSIVGELKMI